MVSVSFLLIIFFMLVGELSKPKVMDLSLPEKYWEEKEELKNMKLESQLRIIS
ncbi:Biopolymer transport protein ExbD/TolR [compost metagenome]